MRLHDGTGTHYGMLWGLWLLDPGSNWAVQQLAAAGLVPSEFDSRPAAHDDPETLKVHRPDDGWATSLNRYAPNFVDRTPGADQCDRYKRHLLNHTEELADQEQLFRVRRTGLPRPNLLAQPERAELLRSLSTRLATTTSSSSPYPFDAGSGARPRCATALRPRLIYYDVRGSELDAALPVHRRRHQPVAADPVIRCIVSPFISGSSVRREKNATATMEFVITFPIIMIPLHRRVRKPRMIMTAAGHDGAHARPGGAHPAGWPTV